MQKTPRGITLDVSGNRNCAISILQPDLVRVRFIKNASPREPRTWMVPAHGANDVPWEGRDRSDDSSWPIQDFELNQIDGEIFVTTSALTLTIKSNPLSLAWSLPSGEIFAQDRPAHPYIFSNKTNNLTHALARHPADRYYGLGDKTGKLDLHGRRLRTTMIDSLGYNPETGDPLYKHWPFVITRDGATGTAWGLFYDSFSEATFDLGCEHDNYYGLYRSYEAAGELDYYVFPGPQVADVTSKFLELTGRPPIPPRWTLGFAQTAMAIADSAHAQERMEEFIARCASEDIPVSAFHFGSGYTTIGPRRYVFTWNHDKYPDRKSTRLNSSHRH